MTLSMTGFARKELAATWGNLSCEMKSVNHRYLETYFRLPDSLKLTEIPLRNLIRKHLNRGKVECQIRFTPQLSQGTDLEVNQTLVQSLAAACQQISETLPATSAINPLAVLQWPGVLAEANLDMEALQTSVLELAGEALHDLIEHRQREGHELARAIEDRLDSISELVADVRKRLPEILASQRQNLADKVAELQVDLDPQRLEQEVVLLAQKADVAEELDRLDAHVQETRHVLKQQGPIGRRLDFLMQEFNREANTLSSKSIVTETTSRAVDLKVLIEQMREQIQNIE